MKKTPLTAPNSMLLSPTCNYWSLEVKSWYSPSFHKKLYAFNTVLNGGKRAWSGSLRRRKVVAAALCEVTATQRDDDDTMIMMMPLHRSLQRRAYHPHTRSAWLCDAVASSRLVCHCTAWSHLSRLLFTPSV